MWVGRRAPATTEMMKAARVWAGGMELGPVYLKGINPESFPPRLILEKKAMRPARPPKGVAGFSVPRILTCGDSNIGLQVVCIVW